MIAALALFALSPPDLRAAVDGFRRELGLPAVRFNASLQKAAQAHADYMLTNRTFGHTESPGAKGYTGRTPGDRARAFGYVGANGEAVTESSLGVQDALGGLFAAPYHRAMFMQPLSPDFGAASAGNDVCIKIGGPCGDGVVFSPPDRAKDVPVVWDGTETPDPMRAQSAQGPFGYPIVVAFFGTECDRLRLVSAVVTDQRGRQVESYVLHPGNDRFARGLVSIVPVRPFSRNSVYSVRVQYVNAHGAQTLSWSFQTSSRQGDR